MMRRTFLEAFVSVPGMSALYQHWAASGASLHFVSSSPWHLYEPLQELLDRDGFPARSMSLKMIRVKDRSVMNLLKTGIQTKPAQIEPILSRFPQRRFILVGDSGEQDPKVYAQIFRAHPGQIQAICIRNVDQSIPDDQRYQSAFAGIDPQRWCLFTDPASLHRLVTP
jgi:phosphatidate phosphatase APP1